MVGRARTIEERDVAAATAFLQQDPVQNIALLSRLAERPRWFAKQDPFLGYYEGDELVALCHVAPNILLTEASEAAVDAFVRHMRTLRYVGSIVGPSPAVLRLLEQGQSRYGGFWSHPRNIREAQPVMVWSGVSAVPAHPEVQVLTTADYDSYYAASAHMYTYEVGVDPELYGPSYGRSVKARLREGKAFGVKRNGEVLFKADLGTTWRDHAQIAGVWLDPRLRGRGLAASAMTGVLELCARTFGNQSLYVNDFNLPALRTYNRCGFTQVGQFATIHF